MMIIIINAITPTIIAALMIVAISIPKILSLDWPLSVLEDWVNILFDEELGCFVYSVEPTAATVLLEELLLVSEGWVGLEIGVGTVDLSGEGWTGGGLLVFDLSTLFVEGGGWFVLVFFNELLSVDGGGVLFIDPEVGWAFAVYLLFIGGSNGLDYLTVLVAFG